MKLMVALENRFTRTPEGAYYSLNVFGYSFWQRYLRVFDEVIVFARVRTADLVDENKERSDGPNVSFFELPYFVGPLGYLRNQSTLRKLAKLATDEADAFILRTPGTMSNLLWRELVRRDLPYGVEVVGDSVDALENSGANPFLLSVLLRIIPERQRKQCAGAACASYVTEKYLQKLYPCLNENFVASSIEMTSEAYIDNATIERKASEVLHAIENKSLVLCHAGTMDARYKGQEYLIRAVRDLLDRGWDVKLNLLGDGKYRSYYERSVEVLGLVNFVEFKGNVPHGANVRSELDKAQVFVLPSLTEGLPRATIEAMARGLLCFGTNVGGVPEQLPKSCLFEAASPQAIVSTLDKFHQEVEAIPDMLYQNLRRARNYSHEKLTKTRDRFYKTVSKKVR